MTGGDAFGFSVQSTSPGLFLKETDQTNRKGFVAMLGGGMYIGGSVDFIAIDANNGNRAVTINNNLNVGIGTTGPGTKLHVVDSTALQAQFSGYSYRSPANNSRAASGSLRVGNGSGSTGLLIDYTDQGQTLALIQNEYTVSTISELRLQSPFISFYTGTTASERMRITADGQLLLNRTGQPPITNSLYGNIVLQTDAVTNFQRIRFDVGTTPYWGLTKLNTGNFAITGLINTTWDDHVLEIQQSNGYVGIGVPAPTQKLDVNGLVKHLGLDMTAGIQVDQITSYTKTLNGAANTWHDTGIDGSDLGSNGSYMIQVYNNVQQSGVSNYAMYWTGTMSWYYTGTNSVNTSEIYLNSAGHYRGMDLELRTISSPNNASPPSMRIQFKSNQTLTNHPNFIFKFRRLI